MSSVKFRHSPYNNLTAQKKWDYKVQKIPCSPINFTIVSLDIGGIYDNKRRVPFVSRPFRPLL